MKRSNTENRRLPGLFQGYYWMHHYDQDKNLRDQYKDHPYYQDCIDFCSKWDQKSFDPNYKEKISRLFHTYD